MVNSSKPSVLHIAGWYPNPYGGQTEGIFIRNQIDLFSEVIDADLVVVQVRVGDNFFPCYKHLKFENGADGHFLFTRFSNGSKISNFLNTLLLQYVLLRKRAWRYRIFHFHIAIPNLLHVGVWGKFWRKKIIISEHWSAYHFNFSLQENVDNLKLLRQPFQYGFPTLVVSESLGRDIRRFSSRNDFAIDIIPNAVPRNAYRERKQNHVPSLFTANRWVKIKNPIPMLKGLANSISRGNLFYLHIGGDGVLLQEMKDFVLSSSLANFTIFYGWMTPTQISERLKYSDGLIYNSYYETFSIACAQALCAGVPLIGPDIPAICEYTSEANRVSVLGHTSQHWSDAIKQFTLRYNSGGFDPFQISKIACHRFDPELIKQSYKAILKREDIFM